MALMIDRTLVTGATGFVGSAVVHALVENATGKVVAASRQGREWQNGVTPVECGNLAESFDWASSLAGVTHVIHCAARVHQIGDTSSDSLTRYRKINTEATLSLAMQAKAAGVRRFVFLSTIKVLGERTKPGRPFTEADPACASDPYAVSKLEAEEGLLSLSDDVMEVSIIRPVLVYGPGVGGNFRTMLRWVRKGIPLPLGSIKNARSLLSLPNLVSLILTVRSHPRAADQIFLACDGAPVATPDLLRAIARAMDQQPRLVPCPPGFLSAASHLVGWNEQTKRLLDDLVVDSGKARKLLGWQPPQAFEQGVADTVNSFLGLEGR